MKVGSISNVSKMWATLKNVSLSFDNQIFSAKLVALKADISLLYHIKLKGKEKILTICIYSNKNCYELAKLNLIKTKEFLWFANNN